MVHDHVVRLLVPDPDGGQDEDREGAQDEDVGPEWQHSSNAPFRIREVRSE
jgi:hypothetical protein